MVYWCTASDAAKPHSWCGWCPMNDACDVVKDLKRCQYIDEMDKKDYTFGLCTVDVCSLNIKAMYRFQREAKKNQETDSSFSDFEMSCEHLS